MEKSPLKSPIVHYAVCFDPSHVVKNQDKSIIGFVLLSQRLLCLKQFKICVRSKVAVQNFCQRCSNFTLQEIQGI